MTVAVALVLFLSAQSTKVELSGVVRDPGGLPVPGAEVRLLHNATQTEQSTATGTDGTYHFFAIQPGNYAITVSKDGFATLRRDGVILRIGDQIELDLAIRVG